MPAYKYIKRCCSKIEEICSKSMLLLTIEFYWGFAFLPKQITLKKRIFQGLQGYVWQFSFSPKGHQCCWFDRKTKSQLTADR